MGCIAVIDTETNWSNQVMSVGVVIADDRTFKICDKKYYIFTPEYKIGGMFSYALTMLSQSDINRATRRDALSSIRNWLSGMRVEQLYAYNAAFDKRMLPELHDYQWHDIMRLAAYRQYNRFITDDIECCGTGRLKGKYGVETVFQMMSGNPSYRETHNALNDAVDELDIMKMLGLGIESYNVAKI